jgi:hypothetical protein
MDGLLWWDLGFACMYVFIFFVRDTPASGTEMGCFVDDFSGLVDIIFGLFLYV